MSRQLAMSLLGWIAVGLVSVASSMGASAQVELVLREAVFGYAVTDPAEIAGWERAESDGQAVFLGNVLLELAPEDILDIGLSQEDSWGRPTVLLSFAIEASEAFSELTEARIGQAIAIVMDGRVVSAPVVQERISGGQLQITGLATVEEAQSLVDAFLASGETVDPMTRQLEALETFRAEVDASTPASLAEALIEAATLGDPLVLAQWIHPEVLAEVRRQLAPEMQAFLEQRSARPEEETRQLTRAIGLETLPSMLSAYTDVQVVALGLTFGWAGEPQNASSGGGVGQEIPLMPLLMDLEYLRDLRRIALVEESGPNAAYVVVEPEVNPGMTDGGMSAARVLSFRRVDGGWRLLLPS